VRVCVRDGESVQLGMEIFQKMRVREDERKKIQLKI